MTRTLRNNFVAPRLEPMLERVRASKCGYVRVCRTRPLDRQAGMVLRKAGVFESFACPEGGGAWRLTEDWRACWEAMR